MSDFGRTGGEGGCGKPPEGRTYRHAAYGIVVDCPFRLSSIEEAAVASGSTANNVALGTPDYSRVRSDGLEFAPDDWFHHSVLPDGSIYLKADEVFEAVVSAEGRQVICAKAEGVDERTLEAFFLNFIPSTSLVPQGEETGEPGRTSPADAISSTRLAGFDRVRVLTTSSMNIRYRALDRLAWQFLYAEHVAQEVFFYALRYARRYALLEQVARAAH